MHRRIFADFDETVLAIEGLMARHARTPRKTSRFGRRRDSVVAEARRGWR
jgi:hypothetical protein